MKNNFEPFYYWGGKKLLKIMKVFTILFIFSIMAVSASTYSQETKLTVDLKNSTVKEVLENIENQSEYIFFYKDNQLNLEREVNINLRNKTIFEVLNLLFDGTNYVFQVDDRQVMIGVDNNLPEKVEENTINPEINSQQPQKKITGKVTDADGIPLPGASIVIKGTTNGVTTDMDGNFTLPVSDNAKVLVFSFVGMKTQEIILAKQTELNIQLKTDASELNEVVIVGYGVQKKANLTGAIEHVGAEVFENRSLSNTAQALQGVVPNLNIALEDGKPTRSASFNVRGTTSIGQGGSALILIDGVEGDPALLNPNDIESVSVLKDAASAAIYGARGSLGVVLITTKNPVKGKTTINYSTNFSLQSPTATPHHVSDGVVFAEHFRAAYFNYMGSVPTSINNGIQAYSDEWLETFKERKEQGITDEVVVEDDGTYTYYGNTDWYDELYKDYTFTQDHNITVSGGNDKSDFYVSGRFYDYGGLYNYNPDTYKSLNIRAKGSLQATDWLKVANNMEFSNTDYHNPFVSSYSYTVQRYIEVASFASMPIYNPDGTYTKSGAYSIGAFKDGNNKQDIINRLLKNTTSFSTNFLKNKLCVNGDFSFRYKTYEKDRKRVAVPYSTAQDVISYLNTTYNDYTETNANTLYTATNLFAEYEDHIAENHYFKAMAGYNYETSKYETISAQRNGLLLEDAESINLALGESISTSSSENKWQIVGMFFRLNYGYKDRYLLEVNGRYDGSSKFPENQQWAFFPSVSAGWRISEEPFWKVSKDLFSDMKIRASYGSLGNGNVDPYSYLELLTISTSSRVLNGALNKYTSAPNVIPSSLTWETATTSDLGIDFGMLDGKLRFTGDVYIRKTTDMYTVGVTLPDVFGADSPKGNYADMTTKGWEVTVSYQNHFQMANKPFKWEVQASMFDYVSKIDKYNNSTNSLSDYYKGMTVGEIWGYKTDGLFQTESDLEGYENTIVKSSLNNTWQLGDVKFVDLNDNGKIDYGDDTVDDPGDQVVIGNSEPRYRYSFNLKADWNNFFFSAFFQGVGRQDWFPSKESSFWGQYNRPYNSLPTWHVNNYWTEDNPNAYLPRLATYNSALGWGSVADNRYLQNVAYIRLKNLQLGYSLPQSWISKIKMTNARIFVSGENLWCWSPLYKHTKDFDVANATVNTDSDLSSNNMGDGNNYPLMKSFYLGLSLTF